ncbi:retroviral-like aspartic protease family protein [bacterium]|nr:retroviral-like aspartic protease family protein [bacterium]
MLFFRYNKSERPSAPYIVLEIAPAGRRRKPTRRRAKLDSGASLTVIPESLIRRWRIRSSGAIRVRAYNGQESVRPIYSVDIIIGSRRFQDIEVTIAPRRNILLGRDIMNKLRITLDGTQERVEIHDI